MGRVAILLGLVLVGACSRSPEFNIERELSAGEQALEAMESSEAERAFLLVMDQESKTPAQTRRALIGLADCYDSPWRSNKLVILATCEEVETLDFADCRRLAFRCESDQMIEAAFRFSEAGLRKVRPEAPRDLEFEELHARLETHPGRGPFLIREESSAPLESFRCDFPVD